MSVEARINTMLQESNGGAQTFEIVVEAGFVTIVTEDEVREVIEELMRRKQLVPCWIRVEVEEIG